jgi:hypothetical protein
MSPVSATASSCLLAGTGIVVVSRLDGGNLGCSGNAGCTCRAQAEEIEPNSKALSWMSLLSSWRVLYSPGPMCLTSNRRTWVEVVAGHWRVFWTWSDVAGLVPVALSCL